jgi:D-cysteine desulfhydrase family pyridoxal phosphate-dependent enzyme
VRERATTGLPSPPRRYPLATLPTPLEPLPRLGRALGFDDGALWVKRDDLAGRGGGGNKVRKLEYLVADALARGARTLVTAGAAQSNHVRLTAAAAGRAGLDCVAVLGGTRPDEPEGNLVLDALFGAELVWTGTYEPAVVERTLAETTLRLATEGRHPYEIPLGGANEIGTLGYVVAAGELAAQAPIGSIVYTATGTGGTHTGLAVGFGHHDRVHGVDVVALDDVAHRIDALTPGVAGLAGRPLPAGHLHLDRSQVGAGYGDHTRAGREAADLAARLEGLVVDPVYSAKALAGLVADRREGRLASHQPVVFLHTGGLPSVFTARTRAWITGPSTW